MTRAQIADYIDHTLLKPEATFAQVEQICTEACEHRFKTVCVNSRFVKYCVEALAGSNVAVCTVVGFPLGAACTKAKVAETLQAISDGAMEIDMVLWIGGVLSDQFEIVKEDICEVANVCRDADSQLKVILETAMLNESQIVAACGQCVKAGAHWVKTSTGFGPGGATVDVVRIMHREVTAHGLKVKASGGIRTLADFEKMIAAGAERIGTSNGLAILNEAGM